MKEPPGPARVPFFVVLSQPLSQHPFCSCSVQNRTHSCLGDCGAGVPTSRPWGARADTQKHSVTVHFMARLTANPLVASSAGESGIPSPSYLPVSPGHPLYMTLSAAFVPPPSRPRCILLLPTVTQPAALLSTQQHRGPGARRPVCGDTWLLVRQMSRPLPTLGRTRHRIMFA